MFVKATTINLFLCELENAITLRDGSRRRTVDAAVRAVRGVLKKAGYNTPIGVGNSKTGCIGTYRQTGVTCPQCPYAGNGCYAQGGSPVAIQAARATTPQHDGMAAIAAIFVGGFYGEPVRLNVSGDLYRHGELDRGYLDTVVVGVRLMLKLEGWTLPKVWTYTHLHSEAIVEWSRITGIRVRISDAHGENGAVVYPHARVVDLRVLHPSVKYVLCPAQTKGTKCRDCSVCAKGKCCVVFDPHGGGKKRVESIVTK